MDLSGIFAPLTTPFSPDGSVSLADLKQNIHRYNETDLAGYVVLGSTGESVMLSRAEMDTIFGAAVQAVAKNKKLIAGTGAESTAETIDRTKRAGELGYAAALVKTPHYYKSMYKADVLIAHYRRVADESPIPVMLYSVPQFTGIALEAPEVRALAEHPNIIGIKDSSGNVQRVAEMIAVVPPAFQILVGSAATIYPSLALGARGGILALACALPEKCVALFELVRKGHHEKAREFQSVLARASKSIGSDLGIAGIKYVMDQRGYRGGNPRLPLRPLHHEEKKHLTDLLATLEPAAVRA
ncbi:MAG TPA: dihydrodipicolinate synthase family protein [Candidatus Acidoferrum sp.]|jgi:4-hydroxy-2-oxoglutarate aldolase|nr:dihydrodipicolinate synthase family protein [Candidatus Acidoferrum sp.]